MTTSPARIGMCFDRSFPATEVIGFARQLEEGGADDLWVIEDCFYTAGISLAAAALTNTRELTVGIGILPAVARNPAITAMEIATLCQLAPGRIVPGIGHGVQSWMAQMGVKPASPVTALEEVLVAVRRLLAGEEVSARGEYVNLDAVRLDEPPATPPPVLSGVRGPRSVAMSGRAADGLVLAEPGSPPYVAWARQQAGNPDGFVVAAYAALCVDSDRTAAYRAMAPWLAGLMESPSEGMRALPFFDELAARFTAGGVDALTTMPEEWWRTIGPIGTLDDAAEHINQLEAAGADHIGLFPAPDLQIARGQIADVLRLAAR